MGKLLGIRLGSSVRHMSAFSMLYGGICSSFRAVESIRVVISFHGCSRDLSV